jgi:hypothetical protein
MARTPSKDVGQQHFDQPETLAEMLFVYLADPMKRRELEEYRVEFEAVHGPTDLTKRYTSTWPQAQQDWLIKNDTKRYFDGLPPFAKAYLRGKMEIAALDGKLDDMPDNLLRLFIERQMTLDHESRRR